MSRRRKGFGARETAAAGCSPLSGQHEPSGARRGWSARSSRHAAGGAEGEAPPERPPEDPIEALIRRSRRCRQRGETRRALVLLREACALDEWRARTWTLLGARLMEAGRRDEAAAAFEQARWLRVRAGEKARAAVTARLAAQLERLAA